MCSSCEWEGFLHDGGDVLGDIDELPEKVEDYAASIREKVEGMMSWAEDKEHVTEKMIKALENIHSGVKKWLQ